VGDCLRRIAESPDRELSSEDFSAVVENVKYAAGLPDAKQEIESFTADHINNLSNDASRAVLTQIGPVRNIDRLAQDQKLRFSPNGITLIYGENGSGKSGYIRIAKKLCRSLKKDDLRGDVYSIHQGSKSVMISYRQGDGETTEIEWDPDTTPPKALQQVSVFDSQNANLYISQGNKIAYLPTELALLEHHGDVCRRIEESLKQGNQESIKAVSVPLPTGYTNGTAVSALMEALNQKAQELPSEKRIKALCEVSEDEQAKLTVLERELASDPVAMAALRHRATKLLNRVKQRFEESASAYSVGLEQKLGKARTEAQAAKEAALLTAEAQFGTEKVAGVGAPTWRVMFEAARKFAAQGHEPLPDRLPEAHGNLCLLCQEPLTPSGADRMRRFNDYVAGEATRRADDALKTAGEILEAVRSAIVPEFDTVRDTLTEYAALSPERKGVVTSIGAALSDLAGRRESLLQDDGQALPMPDLYELKAKIEKELTTLSKEADEFEKQATHGRGLDTKREELAELKDRMMLANNKSTVLQRRKDLSKIRSRLACVAVVASRPVTTQITALRKSLVTEELQARMTREIEALDLTHLRLEFSDSSSNRQSLFTVGLQSVQKAKTQNILSEGEQRALALACFLAEIGEKNAHYGLLVDDPVSSLDHRRIRQVAKRLVAEAQKGRQVVIFTHNISFFNEVLSEAAELGSRTPLIKSVITKTLAQGFGVVSEDSEPWIADLKGRLPHLEKRLASLKAEVDTSTDAYRRKVGDFYSDLRETWERAVEELVLGKTVARFDPRVQTSRLKSVEVTNEVYRTIHFAMSKCSERSGHDMAAGRDIPLPKHEEMEGDFVELDTFCREHKKRGKAVSVEREKLEAPTKASFD
jgi:energy-coupling factor transporter ATP-binding protein EcfA2